MPARRPTLTNNADVAQLVEHHLAKVDVASSNLVVRSKKKQLPGAAFFVPETSFCNSSVAVTDIAKKKSLYLM